MLDDAEFPLNEVVPVVPVVPAVVVANLPPPIPYEVLPLVPYDAPETPYAPDTDDPDPEVEPYTLFPDVPYVFPAVVEAP